MAARSRTGLTSLPPPDKGKLTTVRSFSSLHSSDDDNQVVPFSFHGDNGDEPDEKQNNNNRKAMLNIRPPHTAVRDDAKEDGQFFKPEHVLDGACQGSVCTSDEDSGLHSFNSDQSDNCESLEEQERPEASLRGEHYSQQRSEASDSEAEEELIKPSPAFTAQSTPVSTIVNMDLSRLSKLAVIPGTEAHFVQGYILRVKTILGSQYHFYINNQLILMADKQMKNRTSNYHLFDMTRSVAVSSKLSKKSGNYIGKLRSNFSKKKYVLIGNFSRKTELGAMVFGSISSSSEPRRLTVIFPPLTKRLQIEGLTVGDTLSSFSVLIDLYRSRNGNNMVVAHSALPPKSLQIFENKDPIFENGFYRLNFSGRVSIPSVKNFQLVYAESVDVPNSERPIYFQFGKVDDKKFHLDFRAPITPIQAFATALAQFNL